MTEPFTPGMSLRLDGPFPQDFGRYRLEQCLGHGGQGTVYRAFDTCLRAPVALKAPSERVRQNPALLTRFYREAHATARLRQEPHL